VFNSGLYAPNGIDIEYSSANAGIKNNANIVKTIEKTKL